MDAKITKQRLGRLLSYDWLKIIGVAAAVIIIWSLIFTVSATRITPAQQFTVFNHYANRTLDRGSFYAHYDGTFEKGVFSYEVIELDTIDLVTAGENRYTMCDTRFSTGQGDMIYIPNITDTEMEKDGLQMTYLESFLCRYKPYIISWDEYLASARTYLNDYYNGDYVNAPLNEAKAERDFRARVTENKDKRFRKESKIKEGVKDEFARLNKYRDAFVKFEKYLEEGVVKLETVAYKDYATGEVFLDEQNQPIQKNYALNICPDENKANKLKEQVCYSVVGEDGTVKESSQNMCVMLFSLPEMDDDFQYETILYLNTVIADSLTPTQA